MVGVSSDFKLLIKDEPMTVDPVRISWPESFPTGKSRWPETIAVCFDPHVSRALVD